MPVKPQPALVYLGTSLLKSRLRDYISGFMDEEFFLNPKPETLCKGALSLEQERQRELISWGRPAESSGSSSLSTFF